MHEPTESESGIPWSFVLDPSANVRALGQVQRRGLHAASEAVDRLLTSMAGEHGEPTRRPESQASSDLDIGGMASLWVEFLTRGLSEMVRIGQPATNGAGTSRTVEGQPAAVDIGGPRSDASLRLAIDLSEAKSTTGEIWLWNRTGRRIGPLRLHVGGLRSPEGRKIPSSSVRFDPEVVHEISERSSRGIEVSAYVAKKTKPGTYRGVVQVAGAAELLVAVELCVRRS